MRLEVEFDKTTEMDHSPNSVLPGSRHCSDSRKENLKNNSTRRDDIVRLIEGISITQDSRKENLKDNPTRKDDVVRLQEGMVDSNFRDYRSSSCKNIPSRHSMMMTDDSIVQKRGSVYQNSKEVRQMKKIGLLEGRRDIELSRSSNASFSFRIVDSSSNSDEKNQQKRFPNLYEKSGLADSFMEFSLDTVKTLKGDDNVERDDDVILKLHKSQSVKFDTSCLPSPSESERFSRPSSRARFKKLFDPFMKSKSLRNPSGYAVVDTNECKEDTKRARKSRNLLNYDSHHVKSSSPVHLHGNLKLESKHGMPVFEFSLDCPDDVYIAKTWKASNAFNYTYTFHSDGSRKKSNASARDNSIESSLVGQMQVSCHLCSDLRKGGTFDDSTVTEFVLYDIARARRSVLVTDELENMSNESKPWPAVQLHPDLEIAAIVIQDAIEKRESLKYNRVDKFNIKNNLLDLSITENQLNVDDSRKTEKVKVVIPSGNHGLPSCESDGPSSILDRWRSGGRCDCGGWDMACPLTVIGNSNILCAQDQPLVDTHCPLELSIQGRKEKTPAVTMRFINGAHYSVSFHAQLSALQAFSICVAMLHATQASADSSHEKAVEFPRCNSLKMYIAEDEAKFVVQEEVKKDVVKRAKETLPSYMPHPPFSPIARV